MDFHFTIEALSNIHSLRAYIYPSNYFENISECFSDLNVFLGIFHHASAICITLKDDKGCIRNFRFYLPEFCEATPDELIFIPRKDYIEVKVNNVKIQADKVLPLNLSEDTEKLQNASGLKFYCRNCGVCLTTQNFKRIFEMPQPEWLEIAEQWFCGGCCGSGGNSQQLINRLSEILTLTPNTCLISPFTVAIHDSNWFLNSEDKTVPFPNHISEESVARNAPTSSDDSISSLLSELSLSDPQNEKKESTESIVSDESEESNESNESKGSKESNGLNFFEASHILNKESQTLTDNSECKTENLVSNHKFEDCCDQKEDSNHSSHSSHHHHDHQHQHRHHDHNQHHDHYLHHSEKTISPPYQLSEPPRLVPGSGIWQQMFCSCSNPIGLKNSFENEPNPHSNSNVIHMYKHHLSTHADADSDSNLFKWYDLESIMSSQLLSLSQSSSSQRFVIRNLNDRQPLILIVILNPESLILFGSCDSSYSDSVSNHDHGDHDDHVDHDSFKLLDNIDNAYVKRNECKEEKDHPCIKEINEQKKENFKKSMKVMFRTCSFESEDEEKGINDWCDKQFTEDIFLENSVSAEFVQCLSKNSKHFPLSCRNFQNFTFSFLRFRLDSDLTR